MHPSNAFDFKPASEIQKAFILSCKRESMFDGGVGNGKTTGGLARLLYLANSFPGSRWVVARQTYKTLMQTTYKTWTKICPPDWVKREPTQTNPEMVLDNGSQILWLHLDSFSLQDLMSLEINGAFISQAEEIAPEMWDHLDSRIGRWNPPSWGKRCPSYIWGECNPNGHDWIYFRFHPEVIGEEHPDRAYFFGETSINREILGEVYYQMLMKKPEAWKRRWVYGSRDIFEGAIHPEFKREIQVYDADRFDPFDSLNIKSCWGWMDYGLSAPTCVLLSASTTDNFHFITHEYYRRSTPGRTITIRDHAAEINKLVRDNRYSVRGVWADPSIFFESTRDRRTATTSVAQEYRECGLYLTRADNNETSSIANLQQLFHFEPSLRNPVTGGKGSPRLFVSSRCTNLIEQIQLQRHSETRNPLTGEKEFTEERAQGIPDHAYDPLRYFANSSVWQAPKLREQPRIPLYRTSPVTEKAVKGYTRPGQAPRRSHDWRQLPNAPQINRVEQHN